ncbi:MAG: ABC transporter ATP-binding protein [Alphaproteobacteria bacterium]
MNTKLLEVIGLNKHFGGIHVTQNIDFTMDEGDKSAIIGPNGAGKSTFFNLLTGYHIPESGTIIFDGHDITHWPPHRTVHAGITRAFQVSNIFHRMSVFENVRSAVHAQMGRSLSILSRADRIGTDETERVLGLCGLLDRRGTTAGELSQGDKKKLELAIALAGKPKLVLLDEPTAGMSLEETQETMALVDRLNADFGLTVLFTEHDMSVIFGHARKVMLLHRGEIIMQGTPDEVRASETAQKIYLGELHL